MEGVETPRNGENGNAADSPSCTMEKRDTSTLLAYGHFQFNICPMFQMFPIVCIECLFGRVRLFASLFSDLLRCVSTRTAATQRKTATCAIVLSSQRFPPSSTSSVTLPGFHHRLLRRPKGMPLSVAAFSHPC